MQLEYIRRITSRFDYLPTFYDCRTISVQRSKGVEDGLHAQ